MKTLINPGENSWQQIIKRPVNDVSDFYKKVENILAEIRQNGTRALKKYTLQFDGVYIDNFEVTSDEIHAAQKQLEPDLKKAIHIAAENIEKFHSSQKTELKKIETMPGVTCWQKAVPIEKAGLYVPGGTAPLFSSVLMLGIPANVAGCKETVLCTPPDRNGNINPAVLYAAEVSRIKKIFKIGGIQAIAALAYGISPIPKVDKLFGPGNQFVTAAKQLVSMNDVAIDMPAGPSEVMIVADSSAKAEYIAADLLSQAEHGADSQVVLLTNDRELVGEVKKQLTIQIENIPRKKLAEKSLDNSMIIIMEDRSQIIPLINAYAPEHLIISTVDSYEIAEQVVNSGSVFLGNYTPESAGDYASGTNHTLPTNGWAKSYSGVNLDSFMKKITFQKISENGLKTIGPVIETMAASEQLEAHKNAVTIRLNDINK